MSRTRNEAAPIAKELPDQKKGWLAVGGVTAAILAASCCIGPLALLSLGISGAWIGNLTALEPYKPLFGAIAFIFIGLGFRRVYFTPEPICEPDSYCARPASKTVTKTALWAATALVIAALTVNWWAPFFY